VDRRPFDALADSDPESVQLGVQQVERMTLGAMLEVALDAANFLAGPWSPGAPNSLASAYRLASSRRPIADAICGRFGKKLAEPMNAASQEFWRGANREGDIVGRSFTELRSVYGNGEFPWGGFWTVTEPPSEIHDELIRVWEMYLGPITRWRLPVRPGARVWTIDHPSDWVRLVETYPMVAKNPHSGWELPGPNQHVEDITPLLDVPGQNAVRSSAGRHVLPDWEALVYDYQGVHLSWAGFLTTEGYVSDLADGGATMLRYWASERTRWLEDVFAEPEPLDAPQLTGGISETIGLDATSLKQDQFERMREEICTKLGR
jgi:hypothetical protein